MLFGNVVDQLLDQNCLADTRAAEQTDLAAAGIRRDQVDDLDAGFINFCLRSPAHCRSHFPSRYVWLHARKPPTQ